MPLKPKRAPPHALRIARLALIGTVSAALIGALAGIVIAYLQTRPSRYEPPPRRVIVTRPPEPPSRGPGGETAAAVLTATTPAVKLAPAE